MYVKYKMEGFCSTIVTMEKHKYYTLWLYFCSLRGPACKARVPYCHLWPSQLHNILPHYLINTTIIYIYIFIYICIYIILKIKCVFWFFVQRFVWNISHSKKNWARYDQKCILVFTWSNRYSRPSLLKLEFSLPVLEKYSNITFYENPSSGSRVFPCGQTDGQTWWGW